jgi:hypothetical protein
VRDKATEDFVTNVIAAQLAVSGWELRAVAAPGMGSGTILRPNPDAAGRRPQLKGAVVIDVIARKGGRWLFLENKDRFSSSDLLKLTRLRDSGLYSRDLAQLVGSAAEELRFGLGMPDTAATRAAVARHASDLDCYGMVADDRSCEWLGVWSPGS